jgi:hypothetical protein
MKFSSPWDDDVFPEVFSRICFGNSETKDPHSQVLEGFQPEYDLAHPIDLRARKVIGTQNAITGQFIYSE